MASDVQLAELAIDVTVELLAGGWCPECFGGECPRCEGHGEIAGGEPCPDCEGIGDAPHERGCKILRLHVLAYETLQLR